jgi:hypothetical protein
LSMPCKMDEIFSNFCYDPYQSLAVSLIFDLKILAYTKFRSISSCS